MPTKIDLTAILPLLPENYRDRLETAIARLEAKIATGKLRAVDHNDAKFTINNAVDKIVDAYNAANGYGFDKIVSTAHDVPFGLKEAEKRGKDHRAAMLRTLLPLNELLKDAKLLIVKRVPGEKTEKQIAEEKAREGKAMTCQCCGRDIFAERGKIAHHGYERPGDGWQTSSCMGALYAPFEASRTRLGSMINGLTNNRDGLINHCEEIAAERRDIVVPWVDYAKPYRERNEERTYVNRMGFAEALAVAGIARVFRNRDIKTFDDLKADEIASTKARIKHLNERIAYEQARYDGWKETHRWQARQWIKIEEA